ncbi:hypothetical protein ACIQLJ_08470 [Microbacterium sp. NPDC091313]
MIALVVSIRSQRKAASASHEAIQARKADDETREVVSDATEVLRALVPAPASAEPRKPAMSASGVEAAVDDLLIRTKMWSARSERFDKHLLDAELDANAEAQADAEREYDIERGQDQH